MKIVTKLWIPLIILALLSPVGLILPEYFKAGSAWGEWGVEELQELVGYTPEGLAKISELWKSPMPDYAFRGKESASLHTMGIFYIISAIFGMSVTALIIILAGRIFIKKG